MIPLPTSLIPYAATALIAATLATTATWQVQSWRYDSKIAAQEKATAQAAIRQAERQISAQSQANKDNTHTGERHAQLQNDLAALRGKNIDHSRRAADFERLLHAQCASATAASVPPRAARSSFDAIPPEWTIDHWLTTP